MTRFMVLAVTLTVLLTCVSDQARATIPSDEESRTLSFYHTHTRKSLTIEYYRGGRHLDVALATVDEFLSDFRNGESRRIDPALLDLLHRIKVETGTQVAFEVISAYRSPQTNEMLREAGRGVARKSMHLEGKAIDVRLADVPLEKLRDVALALEGGGVGFYRGSNFVHVDTGRVRRW